MKYLKLCIFYLIAIINIEKIACYFITNCECGIPNSQTINRIVGGIETEQHEFPWLVEISLSGLLHCGGSLLNDLYVVTAGHCVDHFSVPHLSVVLGRHNRKRNEGIRIPVEDVKIHEQFTSHKDFDENDIALVKLRDRVKFTHAILPICLPHPRSSYGGLPSYVIGWGREHRYSREGSGVVLKGNLRVLPDYLCKASPIGYAYYSANMCAYNDDVDACQGDSGSPLIFKNGKHEIIGIVSWGIECAKKGTPGVYTKVSCFVNWILNNTADANYCRA